MIGKKLAHYEITSHLGTGGMGEVYQATDSKLGRQVAIKLLPEAFTNDADRIARFDREARVLASLNHPNIASIHGIEESAGRRFLVIELIPGETLAERISRGPVPIDEAMTIAKQTAEALDAAHEKGIIHRDLKPANIKLTPDGQVKVLDFGLAKAYEPEPPASNVSNSPTLSMAATQAGMILGTAAYMSPEQAKGRHVDKRADIWAFGVVFYELLTGKAVFQGEDVTETLAAVVLKEPDLNAVPPQLRRLVEKCLQKNPKKRLRDIGDVWDLAESDTLKAEPRAASKMPRLMAAAFVVAVIALGVLAIVHFREIAPLGVSGIFSISLPENSKLNYFMLSPDGRNLAFVSDQGGPIRVWIRPIDSLEARPVPGTDGASFPFWSPDGKTLGFFAQGNLKKLALAGGPAQTLATAPTPRGGSWNRQGVILFAPNINGGLFRVSQDGGTVTQITKAESNDSHRYPEFIGGGDQFLFSVSADREEKSGLFTASLNGGTPTRLLPDGSHTLYVPPTGGASTGALLFERESTLMALPFDPRNLRAVGSPIPIAQEISQAGTVGFSAFTASENGVLLYRTGNLISDKTLVWIDSAGNQTAASKEPQSFGSLALSPDGKHAMVSVVMSGGDVGTNGNEDLWLHDLEHQVPTRFTFGPGRRRYGIWAPDGSYVVYVRNPRPDTFIRKLVSGATAEEVLLEPVGNNSIPLDISHDGKLLVYSKTSPTTKDDLWLLSLDGTRHTVKYLDGPSDERQAQFSPDDKWIAYSSDEYGQYQVFLQSIPPGAKRQVSPKGGSRPRWRKDGKELYYISADLKLMSVPISLGPGTIDVGNPQQLTTVPALSNNGRDITYQPSADGKRFLTHVPSDRQKDAPAMTVRIDWMKQLTSPH